LTTKHTCTTITVLFTIDYWSTQRRHLKDALEKLRETKISLRIFDKRIIHNVQQNSADLKLPGVIACLDNTPRNVTEKQLSSFFFGQ
jgi:hypothetical protein